MKVLSKKKKYKLVYSYKDTKMNLILFGDDELDVLNSFLVIAKKFQMPINSEIHIYIKQVRGE